MLPTIQKALRHIPVASRLAPRELKVPWRLENLIVTSQMANSVNKKLLASPSFNGVLEQAALFGFTEVNLRGEFSHKVRINFAENHQLEISIPHIPVRGFEVFEKKLGRFLKPNSSFMKFLETAEKSIAEGDSDFVPILGRGLSGEVINVIRDSENLSRLEDYFKGLDPRPKRVVIIRSIGTWSQTIPDSGSDLFWFLDEGRVNGKGLFRELAIALGETRKWDVAANRPSYRPQRRTVE